MSISRKVITGSLLYMGYQILTNKKYSGYRKTLSDAYTESKDQIINSLDSIGIYLSTPTDVGSEVNRIKIDNEIKKIKMKLLSLDDKKTADRVVEAIGKGTDVIVETLKHTKPTK
jgi:hypothetical protein